MNAPAKSGAQFTTRNDFLTLLAPPKRGDLLTNWLEFYFQFEVTTAKSSQKVQRRDLGLFLAFMLQEEGSDLRPLWSPRLSKAFKDYLRSELKNDRRRWADRTVNRIIAHLKTFAKWVHKHAPFPLGNPTEKLKAIPTASSLEVDRAITPRERRRILDAADVLLKQGAMSVDRKRYKGRVRPQRATYRAWRNRAIVYVLIETGMRRAAIPAIDIEDVDFEKRKVFVEEKGGVRQGYHISYDGVQAVLDYIRHERRPDLELWGSPALFLPAYQSAQSNGRLKPWTVNRIWNEVCRAAGVYGRTPHSARHAMGKHIIDKTGNVGAVQRQLVHKNAAYSMQYTRVTSDELQGVLDDRL